MSKMRLVDPPISDPTRREALRTIALSVTVLAGRMELEAAQHVHNSAKEEKRQTGSYKPKLFSEHEFHTLGRLAELIIPADPVSGSAKDAGAPEFIDLLVSQNEELAVIFTGGLSWLDAEMRQRHSKTFVEAAPELQSGMLDSLVDAGKTRRERQSRGETYERSDHYRDFRPYGIHPDSDLNPGLPFFDWMRKMTVDAFYTSEIGIKDVDYRGNGAVSKYEVPKEAIDYAVQHSPFA